MSKKKQVKKKQYNLNKKGKNKIILLILALTFVLGPIFILVVRLVQLYLNPYL